MTVSHETTIYHVRISVPRRGGWRAWLPVIGQFTQALALQEYPPVLSAAVESETRRGRDYVCVNVLVTLSATDIAEALGLAWLVFGQAASDDPAGWDMAGATAEVRPARS